MKRIIINILSIMIIVLFCNFAISCNLKDTTGTDYIPVEQRTNSYSSGWARLQSASLMQIDVIDENNPSLYSGVKIHSIQANGLNDSEYTVSISGVNKKNDSRLELVASDFELTSDRKELRLTQSGLEKFKTYSSDFAFRTRYDYGVIFHFNTSSDKVQEKDIYITINISLNKLNYIKENQFEEVLLSLGRFDIPVDVPKLSKYPYADFGSEAYWIAESPNFFIDVQYIDDESTGIERVYSTGSDVAEEIIPAIKSSSSFSKYFSNVEYLENMTMTYMDGEYIVLYFKFYVKNATSYYIDKDIQNINKIVNNSRSAAISIQLIAPENFVWYK